jgi:hypothetical protein
VNRSAGRIDEVKSIDSTAAELTPAEALRVTLELYEFGEDLLRESLRREHPSATEAEIESHVIAWLQTRPGAEQGDAVGRPCRRMGPTE